MVVLRCSCDYVPARGDAVVEAQPVGRDFQQCAMRTTSGVMPNSPSRKAMSMRQASSGLRPLLVMVVIASTSNGSGWDLDLVETRNLRGDMQMNGMYQT